MLTNIRKFEDFLDLQSSLSETKKVKDYEEMSSDPIIYQGYYLTIWPFRNDERHPEKSWGFTISKDPEGKDYLSKTRGSAGNYQECLNAGQEQIENFISRG